MKKYLYLMFTIYLLSCNFTITRKNKVSDRDEAIKIVDSFYYYISSTKIIDAMHLFKMENHDDSSNIKNFISNIAPQSKFILYKQVDHWETIIADGLEAEHSYKLYYTLNMGSTKLFASFLLIKNYKNQIKIIYYQASTEKFIQL